MDKRKAQDAKAGKRIHGSSNNSHHRGGRSLKIDGVSIEKLAVLLLCRFSRYKYTLAVLIASAYILVLDVSSLDIYSKGWLIVAVYPLVILLHSLSFRAVSQLIIIPYIINE